jgi:CheY-like chemotaxis protein
MNARGVSGSPNTDPVRGASPRVNAEVEVLVVDPDPDARELYRHWLLAGGMRVLEAADGREALARIYGDNPAVVLLDTRLPYIDGLQLCALLRGDSLTMSLGIIAVTTDGSPEHVRRIRERGADIVLVKPILIEELAMTVRALATLPAGDDRMEAVASLAGISDVSHLPVRTRAVARARAREGHASTTPPSTPPHLRCPNCDEPLLYERSHVGGVSQRHPEQWDYFTCAKHGTFQYRHRTRKLRPAP